ncbi:4-hydroxy-3-methylbut-2-enyl diphosphate reductase [Salininema proteolyticum]|uniref:4-hydroxy-3-methylbut-2-enyl diphosphate reductase n=1 Tax=Salininema proteolyticum TaxID=1607685 RepID=A0ABV8TYE4_9ACTN
MSARTVLLASPRSFCAGVERAITIVERLLDRAGPPVYVYHHIVHNLHVIERLRGKGAVFVDDVDEVPDGATLVFSAHGVAPAVGSRARGRGLDPVDATCPLVAKVHSEVHRALKEDRHVILIGHDGHDESDGVRGIDPERVTLVESTADVEELDLAGRDLAYACQTTLSQTESAGIIAALKQRYPDIEDPPSEDICYATTNRQNALSAVLAEADFALIVGSRYSSNTTRLWELARELNVEARLIEDSGDIEPDWLDNKDKVALTAGASAPSELVDGVIERLAELGPIRVEERTTAVETMEFHLPGSLR